MDMKDFTQAVFFREINMHAGKILEFCREPMTSGRMALYNDADALLQDFWLYNLGQINVPQILMDDLIMTINDNDRYFTDTLAMIDSREEFKIFLKQE